MNLTLEIFIVRLLADRVRYCRCELPLAGSDLAPDRVVRDLVEGRLPESPLHTDRYLSHSTSWRYEASGVVLTYLVCIDGGTPAGDGWHELRADDFALAAGDDPRQPGPAHVDERQVLSHGIRHLAFLWHTAEGAALRRCIPAEAAALMTRAAPATAGQIN